MAATGASPSPSGTAEHSEHVSAEPPARWPWLRYVTPIAIVLLAIALVVTITRNWNAWEGGNIEQVTDDAYVRGDLTPLSTKVPGIVRSVKVADYQRVRAGDLLVELEDDELLSINCSSSEARLLDDDNDEPPLPDGPPPGGGPGGGPPAPPGPPGPPGPPNPP